MALSVPLAEELRPLLVDVLFDYRRAEWYNLKKHHVPRPPEREAADPAALRELRAIGEHALRHVELSDRQKQSVEDVLGQLRGPQS